MPEIEQDFDWSQLGPTPGHFDLARGLYDQGASFREVRLRLSRDGLRDEFVEAVVNDLVAERLAPLLIAGAPREKLLAPLLARGLGEAEADAACREILSKHQRRLRSADLSGGRWYLAGLALVLAGAVAAVGNITGIFPTVPALGRGLVSVGVLVGGGRYFFGRWKQPGGASVRRRSTLRRPKRAPGFRRRLGN